MVGTDADQSTVTLGSGPGEKTAAVGRGPGEKTAVAVGDGTAGMHAQYGPDTGTAGTADQGTAGADAVESRPDAGTAGRSPGPASQGSRPEGRTGLGGEVVVVVVARCEAQGWHVLVL